MAYQPLARKYRPKNFNDIVGQKGVTLALANSIKLGREPHGVIFSGVRGIGKTTLARIYAKALNCESGPTPDPCGDCYSCVAISEGRHEDVLEIDGASNTGVDDVRALRETIGYVPQRSKYKVYIIDEVHMLSNSAFNALLKTLEEPPDNVIFVFATTELHKIPQTIVGRCQCFYLQKFSLGLVQNRLKFILEQEGLTYSDKALYLVAKQGRGSLRDAITFLDQAIALGDGEVNLESLEPVLGRIATDKCLELLAAILVKDGEAILKIILELDQAGTEFAGACEETAKLARHAFILRDLGESSLDKALLGISVDEVKKLKEISQNSPSLDLNRIFRTLVTCCKELDGSELDRFVFENFLLEWCFDPGLPILDDVLAGQTDLIKKDGQVNQPRVKKSLKENVQELSIKENNRPIHREESAAKSLDVKEVDFPGTWRGLVEAWKQKKPLQARILEEAHLIEYSRDKIIVAVKRNSLAGEKLLQPNIQIKVKNAFNELFGFTGVFKAIEHQINSNQKSDSAPVAEESLLDTRMKEKELEKKRIVEELKDQPMTKNMMKLFNAEIDHVTLD